MMRKIPKVLESFSIIIHHCCKVVTTGLCTLVYSSAVHMHRRIYIYIYLTNNVLEHTDLTLDSCKFVYDKIINKIRNE